MAALREPSYIRRPLPRQDEAFFPLPLCRILLPGPLILLSGAFFSPHSKAGRPSSLDALFSAVPNPRQAGYPGSAARRGSYVRRVSLRDHPNELLELAIAHAVGDRVLKLPTVAATCSHVTS